MGQQGGTGHKRWTVILFGLALLATELALGALEETCNCSTTIDFSSLVSNMCCVNLSRTNVDTLDWSVFVGIAGLRELYLSNCGISNIIRADNGSSTLEILYLDHNQLSELPDNFLKNAPSLRVLQLESNQLQKLPEAFLEASDQIQEIYLDSNNLTSLPSGFFKSSLLELGLSNNSWDCTCTLFGNLDNFRLAPLDTEIVCSTPQRFHGLNLKDIPRQELCRNHTLTAVFISLPLVAILALVTCYFCNQKKKTGYAPQGGKESHLARGQRSGSKGSGSHHSYIPCDLPMVSAVENEKNILLRNQVLLKPSTELLGSSRDLYEEVEIKLGASDDSIVQGSLDQDKPDSNKLAMVEESITCGESEAETVSVTDVLKDSADREKLYMNQSVDYYNLVPGIELEDSDHMEYENIDLC